jgi:hypothetical protein
MTARFRPARNRLDAPEGACNHESRDPPTEDFFVRTRRWPWLLLFVLPIAAAGCAQEVDVKSYDVKYPDREMLRMLTAMVPDGKTMWVFKLMGPEAAVAAQQKAFDDVVASLRFDEKKEFPDWTAPAGWKEEKGGGEFRVATFRIEDGARPLEVAVTILDQKKPGELDSQTILANVNRWRGQMSLPGIDVSELENAIRRGKVDGREVVYADLSALGTYRVPVRNPHGGVAPKKALPRLGGIGNLPFTFREPAEWQPKRPLPQFSMAAFEVVEGKRRAIITVTEAQGDVVANANRWRTQVGLKELPAAEIRNDLMPLKVAGLDAHYLDVVNPKSQQANNRILGVIVPTDGATWFIKMAGPDALVGAQKTNFEAFVNSFKLAQ